MSTTPPRRALTVKDINPNLLKAEYAVRGPIAVRSEEHRNALSGPDPHDLPFDSVISANIGNPQQLDQKPITFFRQVLSCLEYPALLDVKGLFPADVQERARTLLKDVGSVGAYSHSQGAPGIRKSVAKFIESEFMFTSPI
jgi:alanine transaminase